MQIYDLIAGAQQGRAIPNLAQTFGITTEEADAVVRSALPALAQSLERTTLSRGGLADLVKALGDGHHAQILERPDVFTNPRVQQDGQGILGHILGSDSRTRGLALQTARATGLSDSIIEMILPILAQMLMGALSKWLGGGGLGDIMNKIPGGGGMPSPMPQQGGGPSPGGGYGRGFELPPASDAPQGGFPMPPMPGGHDRMGRGGTMEETLPRGNQQPGGGGFGRGFELPQPGQQSGQQSGPQPGGSTGFPFPMPQMPGGGGQGAGLPMPQPQPGGAANPYGDLSDILRRGSGGSAVRGSVRDMLGNALGFQSKGIVSWIIRAVIMRFGWSILKRVLGRAFTGR